MIVYSSGPVIEAAKEYVAAETGSPTLKAKMVNLLKLHSLNEAQHYHLKTLLQRAGVQLPEGV